VVVGSARRAADGGPLFINPIVYAEVSVRFSLGRPPVDERGVGIGDDLEDDDPLPRPRQRLARSWHVVAHRLSCLVVTSDPV
jgi:hypothetical protein